MRIRSEVLSSGLPLHSIRMGIFMRMAIFSVVIMTMCAEVSFVRNISQLKLPCPGPGGETGPDRPGDGVLQISLQS